MRNDLVDTIKKFMETEKIKFKISDKKDSEFWLDDEEGNITVRFRINESNNSIFYDIYAPKLLRHLKEKHLKDVEQLEYLAEEHRNWKLAESIEEIWIILDEILIWAEKNNYYVKEKELI
jgi:predicted RNase H-related nuclease YkuK (DUF458 family)